MPQPNSSIFFFFEIVWSSIVFLLDFENDPPIIDIEN